MAAEPKGIRSVLVGGRLIKAMVDAGVPLALKDLVWATGLTAAQAHGYLTSLRRVGLASQHAETARYELGPYALRLGLTGLRTAPSYEKARDWLFERSSQLDLMAMLSIFTPKGPTAINVVHAQERRVDINIRLGTEFSTLETATGRTFAAFDPSGAVSEKVQQELDGVRQTSATQAAALRSDFETALAEVRANLVLVMEGALLPSFVEVATPIFDEEGNLAAVATFLGYREDLDEGRLEHVKGMLADAEGTGPVESYELATVGGIHRSAPGFEARFEQEAAASDVTGKGVQSVETAARLLRTFVRYGRPLSLKELAGKTGITPALAHAYLVSLKALGLVVQDGSYRLGPFALEIGLAYLRNFDPMDAVLERLPRISERTGHTALLSIWGAFGPTVISVSEAARRIHMNTKVGTVYSVTGTSTGRAFAAFMPRDMTRTLQQSALPPMFTERCVGIPQPFGPEEIEMVRARGFATVPKSLRPGNNAVAAPVFDLLGQVFGVVTIIGDAEILSIAADSPDARTLVDETRALSYEIGYIPPHWAQEV